MDRASTIITASPPKKTLHDIKLSAVQVLKATELYHAVPESDMLNLQWPAIKAALGETSLDPASIKSLSHNLKAEKAEKRRLTGALAAHWEPLVRLQEYCRQNTLSDRDRVELQINCGVPTIDQLQLTASCPARLNSTLHHSRLSVDRLFQIAKFNNTDDPDTFARDNIAWLYLHNPMPNVDRENLHQFSEVMIRSNDKIYYYTVKDTAKVKCGFCGRPSQNGWIQARLGYGSCSTDPSRPSICEVLAIISKYHPNNKSGTTATRSKISAAQKRKLESLTVPQKRQRMLIPNEALRQLPEEVRALNLRNRVEAFKARFLDPVFCARFSAMSSALRKKHYSDPAVCAAISARMKLKCANDPMAMQHMRTMSIKRWSTEEQRRVHGAVMRALFADKAWKLFWYSRRWSDEQKAAQSAWWTEERRLEHSIRMILWWTDERKAAQGIRMRSWWTDERKAAQGIRMRLWWTDERKTAQGIRMRLWWTDERKAAQSIRMIEWWTDERKAAQSIRMTEWWTDERKAAQGVRMRIWWTDERKAAQSVRMVEWWTDERKLIQSNRMKAFWTIERRATQGYLMVARFADKAWAAKWLAKRWSPEQRRIFGAIIAAKFKDEVWLEMWMGRRWSLEQRIQQAKLMIRLMEATRSIASTVIPAPEAEIDSLLDEQSEKFRHSRWEEVTITGLVAMRPEDMHIREFVEWFRQSWDYMVGPGGTIHTSDIANNIYPNDDPFSFASILARDDLRVGQIVNYEAKLEIHKSAIIGYLYNAKPIGENCGNDANVAICHMGQFKVNVTVNVPVPIDEDDDDEGDPKLCDAFSFCYNAPYSSGESMLLTLACGGVDASNASRTEEVIRRGAGVMASLHRKLAEAEANQQPVFRFFRDTTRHEPHVTVYTKRILGDWPVYQMPDVKEARNAPLRISVKDNRMHEHTGGDRNMD